MQYAKVVRLHQLIGKFSKRKACHGILINWCNAVLHAVPREHVVDTSVSTDSREKIEHREVPVPIEIVYHANIQLTAKKMLTIGLRSMSKIIGRRINYATTS